MHYKNKNIIIDAHINTYFTAKHPNTKSKDRQTQNHHLYQILLSV